MKIRIRRLLVPVFWLLAVACLIELPLGQTTIFGENVILWDTLFRAVAAAPVLIHFYREDAVFRGKESWGWKEAALCAAAGFVLSLLATLAVWGLSQAGIQADMSMAEENLLSGPVWLEAVVLLAASPFLEEFFFRGILFQRLQELMSVKAAAVVSALIFGLYHGNLSQGIYGFFMGLVLAAAVERTQTVKAPAVIHMAANLAGLLAAAVNLP